MRFKKILKMLPVVALLGMGTSTLMAQDKSASSKVPAQITSNPYSPAYDHPYRHGVVPMLETQAKMKQWEKAQNSGVKTAATSAKTLSYGGGVNGIGVTSGSPKVYLVIWGSQWGSSGTDSGGNMTFSNDTVGAMPQLQKLFKGLGSGGELWSGVVTQYCDGSSVARGATTCPANAPHVGYPAAGTAFAGIWYDIRPRHQPVLQLRRLKQRHKRLQPILAIRQQHQIAMHNTWCCLQRACNLMDFQMVVGVHGTIISPAVMVI
jgi:serine protease